MEISAIKAVASLAAAILSTAFFGWGALFSFFVTWSTHDIAQIIARHRAENRADDFANKHCSVQERQDAVAYLEDTENSRPKTELISYIQAGIRALFHPPESFCIAKIRKTIPLEGALQTDV